MNVSQELNRFIESLEEIDSELGFVQQVEEAAERIRACLKGKQAALEIQYDYPYLSVVKINTASVIETSDTICETCLLLANHHLHLVRREREKTQQGVHEFLHPLSHYMKSPLTAILGYSSLLEDDLDGTQDEEILHYIRRIGENTKLLVKMIDDLLYISRLNREHEEELPVSVIVSESMKSLEQSENCRSASVTVDEGIPPLHMNRQHALTLFTQLLSNACNHSEKPPTIHIGHRESEFFLRDSGRGISPDNLLKVFRIFFTTSSKETGSTGAGLYIVKKILDLYGGNIRIESSVENGTTVYFRTKTGV